MYNIGGIISRQGIVQWFQNFQDLHRYKKFLINIARRENQFFAINNDFLTVWTKKIKIFH